MNLNWSYSPETPNLGQIRRLLERATLKFGGWPCNSIGHLFYTISSFVHHVVPIGEFKLKLQSGDSQFGSKLTIFSVWPRNFTDDPQNNRASLLCYYKLFCSISYPLVNWNWSNSPETPNLGQIWWFLEPCDLEIWRMTLKNNRTPLLCYFKFVQHFAAIGEFKLELQSRNAQFGSN